MSLAGEGAVAIWHDIAPEGREEFYQWHGQEHMPERVGIPGFLRGRRYVAVRADLEFFNLYEALSLEVLTGSDYLARLNHPTPWTVSTVKHFRKVARSICRVAFSAGRGSGGLAATFRFEVAGDAADRLSFMRERFLPALAGRRGVAGVHLLTANVDASVVRTEEQKARAEPNATPGWVLIIEWWGDQKQLEDLCAAELSDRAFTTLGATDVQMDLYRLQATRTKTDWCAG